MIKLMARSIREYKRASIATPLLVSGEVIMECIIPFLIAYLVNEVSAGCDMNMILRYGVLLVCMAALSLMFGALAGMTCSTASCGLARNLRRDMFYSVQGYSFENIDRFMTSSLVTRMTTDVTNVQNAYMMIIRTAIRAPFMLVFAFAMAFYMGGRMAWIFLFVVPVLGVGLALVIHKTIPLFRKVFKNTTGSTLQYRRTSRPCAWSSRLCARTMSRPSSTRRLATSAPTLRAPSAYLRSTVP